MIITSNFLKKIITDLKEIPSQNLNSGKVNKISKSNTRTTNNTSMNSNNKITITNNISTISFKITLKTKIIKTTSPKIPNNNSNNSSNNSLYNSSSNCNPSKILCLVKGGKTIIHIQILRV